MKKRRHVRSMLGSMSLGALAVALVVGCNQHPLEALEETVTSVNRQENRLPAKTKIDFLFVIDNSGSMCEEQDNLTKNFDAFSAFLSQELGAAADYRIAVTSTDMSPMNAQRGNFLADPALPAMSLNCINPSTNEPIVPDTEACQRLLMNGELDTIIKSGPDGNIGRNCDAAPDPDLCVQEDLELKFRCLATLGITGDGFEKGLEAMRVSLSCEGPNARHFDECCVQVREQGRDVLRYNPACQIGENQEEPDFLRPDAVLVVIIVSDENDCSDPASNPAESRRVICKYGTVDGNGDGTPDGYNDRELCGNRSPADCFRAECGELSAADCRSKRCEIPRSENNACEWFRSDLTPVQDYYRFLTGLKARPLEQLVVATIVGQRNYTPNGFQITYQQGQPPAAECVIQGEDDVRPVLTSDMCCPNGSCKGTVGTSCQSNNGRAFAGRRYLQLAEDFGTNGIGCPAPPEGLAANAQVVTACEGAARDSVCNIEIGDDLVEGKCRPIPNDGRLACIECVTICEDDFAGPLETIRNKVAEIVATYCLDKPPACQITEDDTTRACQTAEERNNPANYPIRVRQQCLLTEDQGGLCQEELQPTVLAGSEWSLTLNQPGCAGGAVVQLNSPPPAGAEVFVEFLVDVSGGSGPASDGGAPPPQGDMAPAAP